MCLQLSFELGFLSFNTCMKCSFIEVSKLFLSVSMIEKLLQENVE